MSDRFVLYAPKKEIENVFHVSMGRSIYFDADYNISPGSLHPLVIRKDEERICNKASWGLIPPDAKEERAGNKNNVVPSEDVQEKDWFTECINRRRCLIPANGFYKWRSSEKKQMPFYIRLLSNQLTAFAGIYDVWTSASGREVYSFAILTTKANSLIEPVDNRMPVLLHREDFGKWLNPSDLTEELYEKLLLEPFELTKLAVNRVSKKVNDLENNGRELIQPVPK
jgi:putative SOS response-associated peptidase YedK